MAAGRVHGHFNLTFFYSSVILDLTFAIYNDVVVINSEIREYINMIRLLPMLPLIIEGILFFICGIYQVATGKESFLMSSYRKKYNYERNKRKVVKACGVVDITMSVFIAIVLPFLYLDDNIPLILLISIPILLCVGILQRILIKRYTDNLENRKKCHKKAGHLKISSCFFVIKMTSQSVFLSLQ